MKTPTKLAAKDVSARLGKLTGWKRAGGSIRKDYELSSFTGAAKFIGRIAPVANALDHHPDLELHKYKHVTVKLTTHSAGGLTERDFELAGKIERLARAQ